MQKKILIVGLVTMLLSLTLGASAFAQIPTTATLSGSVTVTGAGDWSSGVAMLGNVYASQGGTAVWTAASYNGSTDYMTLVDNNSTADGAYLSVRKNVTNFTYSGAGTGNTGLVSKVIIAAGFAAPFNPSAPTIGIDDTSKNANVVSAQTCSSSQSASKYAFHSYFMSASRQYAPDLSTSNFTLFRIKNTSECVATVKLNFDAVISTYPALTTAGTYTNTLIFTATDGQP